MMNMDRKYQVFISSTYTDLKEERQLAVSTILDAGHIPAGMELFKAGNASQLATIKRWIDESDIYLLILGGRYGSIEPISGKSYIEIEYLYAVENNIPVFALVLDETYLHLKASKGEDVFEKDNIDKYTAFKKLVMSKMIRKITDIKDIGLHIYPAIDDIIKSHSLVGWVKGNSMSQLTKTCSTLGIKDIYYKNGILPIDKTVFEQAKEVRIIYTSGPVFFREFQDSLRAALKNSATIKVIIATPNSDYVNEILEMQTNNSEVYHSNDINLEIEQATRTLINLYQFDRCGKVYLGHFNTQFRANIIIIDNIVADYTPTLPPKVSSETISFKVTGQMLFDCKLHFDTMYDILKSKRKIIDLSK